MEWRCLPSRGSTIVKSPHPLGSDGRSVYATFHECTRTSALAFALRKRSAASRISAAWMGSTGTPGGLGVGAGSNPAISISAASDAVCEPSIVSDEEGSRSSPSRPQFACISPAASSEVLHGAASLSRGSAPAAPTASPSAACGTSAFMLSMPSVAKRWSSARSEFVERWPDAERSGARALVLAEVVSAVNQSRSDRPRMNRAVEGSLQIRHHVPSIGPRGPRSCRRPRGARAERREWPIPTSGGAVSPLLFSFLIIYVVRF